MDCEICFRDYQRGAIVPRMIECGHTFCTNCITEQFKTSSNCPKCREPFTKETSEAYPINYALLRSIDDRNASTNTDELHKQLKNKKRELTTIKTEWKETKTAADLNLSKISNGEIYIEVLLNQKCLDVEQTNETLLKINKIIKDVSRCKIVDNRMLKNSVTLSRDDHQNNEDFLQDIYNKLNNYEELYAVTLIDSKVNYARLTQFSNKIYLHAFDSSVPAEPNKTILFSDFKRCLNNSLRAFLQIPCNEKGTHQTVVLKTVNNSNLVHVLLKYCTGETGPVYKGSNIELSLPYRFIPLKTIPLVQSEYDLESNYKKFNERPDNMKDWSGDVCSLSEQGTLVIGKYINNTHCWVAIIEEPKTVFDEATDYKNMKIQDCGIFIEV